MWLLSRVRLGDGNNFCGIIDKRRDSDSRHPRRILRRFPRRRESPEWKSPARCFFHVPAILFDRVRTLVRKKTSRRVFSRRVRTAIFPITAGPPPPGTTISVSAGRKCNHQSEDCATSSRSPTIYNPFPSTRIVDGTHAPGVRECLANMSTYGYTNRKSCAKRIQQRSYISRRIVG